MLFSKNVSEHPVLGMFIDLKRLNFILFYLFIYTTNNVWVGKGRKRWNAFQNTRSVWNYAVDKKFNETNFYFETKPTKVAVLTSRAEARVLDLTKFECSQRFL